MAARPLVRLTQDTSVQEILQNVPQSAEMGSSKEPRNVMLGKILDVWKIAQDQLLGTLAKQLIQSLHVVIAEMENLIKLKSVIWGQTTDFWHQDAHQHVQLSLDMFVQALHAQSVHHFKNSKENVELLPILDFQMKMKRQTQNKHLLWKRPSATQEWCTMDI